MLFSILGLGETLRTILLRDFGRSMLSLGLDLKRTRLR